MTFRSSILAGVNLVRAAIRSPNYVAGADGWTINQDGSAEFNNITIRGGTTVGGTSLYYAGTPAAGNLRYSISDTAGVDAFGNSYGIGVIAYDTGHTGDVGMFDGQFALGSAASGFTNGATIYQGLFFGGDLVLDTGISPVGIDPNHVDSLTLNMTGGQASQLTGSATAPRLTITDGQGTSAADVVVSGSVMHGDLSGNPSSWTRIGSAYSAHYADATLFQGLGGDAFSYHVMPDNSLWLQGLFTCNGAGAGTTVATLPVAPHSGTPHCQLSRVSGGIKTTVEAAFTTGGAMIIDVSPSNGDTFSINARIPLHNVT